MGSFFEQIRTIWAKLEMPQRISLVLILAAFALVAILLGYGATRPAYRVLASGLDRARTAEIAAYLDGQGVPYQVGDRESTVLVPADKLYSLRTNLAEQELLGDGSVGFELLSESSMGSSSFKEQKNYDRAVSGELQRSFKEIPGVASARVIINRPPPSPFLDDDRRPSAAVKLQMNAGRRITERQLSGVIHLVAGAVEGLSPSDVQVMDGTGLLSRGDEDPAALAASDTMEAERAKEQHLTRKAQELLDRALGPGRSMVSVAVDLDFTKRSQASSTPTESKVLRQTTTTSDEATPVPVSGGIAGTANNVEGETTPTTTTEMATKLSEQDTREYVVGKSTKSVEEEVGRVSGMTVSILLDAKDRSTTPAEGEDAEPVEVVTEFTVEEQERFAQLVLDAIGFKTALGAQQALEPDAPVADRFSYSVQSVPFAQPVTDGVAEAGAFSDISKQEILDYLRYLVAGVVALVLLFVARGQLKKGREAWEQERARREQQEQERLQAEQSREANPDFVAQEREGLRERVRGEVARDPKNAAEVMRGWLNG
ncbi:MAG: flagellar basal-body MS-ring/collar protein FliF [Planctomycetota bacterium]|jgi:flagellar M-ring protein FliF|nr:flagellar basal-body MS-ring/collar protein FliF [Planctomycetota bacterium]